MSSRVHKVYDVKTHRKLIDSHWRIQSGISQEERKMYFVSSNFHSCCFISYCSWHFSWWSRYPKPILYSVPQFLCALHYPLFELSSQRALIRRFLCELSFIPLSLEAKTALGTQTLKETCGWWKKKTKGSPKSIEEGDTVTTFCKPFPPPLVGYSREQEGQEKPKGREQQRGKSRLKGSRAFGRIRKLSQTSADFSMPKAIFLPTAACVPLWVYNAWESKQVFVSLPIFHLGQPTECFPYPFQLCVPVWGWDTCSHIGFGKGRRRKRESGPKFGIVPLYVIYGNGYNLFELLFSHTFCFSFFLSCFLAEPGPDLQLKWIHRALCVRATKMPICITRLLITTFSCCVSPRQADCTLQQSHNAWESTTEDPGNRCGSFCLTAAWLGA